MVRSREVNLVTQLTLARGQDYYRSATHHYSGNSLLDVNLNQLQIITFLFLLNSYYPNALGISGVINDNSALPYKVLRKFQNVLKLEWGKY